MTAAFHPPVPLLLPHDGHPIFILHGCELVSQLEHALQAVQLAREDDAGPQLCAATFLHDIGHLVARRGSEMGREMDDLHQFLALAYLRGAFTPEEAPIRQILEEAADCHKTAMAGA